MSSQSNNKTIAKNTIMLYFRMLLTMGVGLFTSRVILQTLGVTDYGIYQSVGGIVGFIGFLNNALATGSSRFLTFELGKGNLDKLKSTFSTTLTIHIALAIIIVILAETVGLWFLYNKLIIPTERFDAAVYCFHFSVLAAAFSITQAPYSASIMSHEKMDLYAYVSIVETVLKLGIVYMLYIGNFDKLKMYATLFFCLTVGLQIFYRVYCVKHFPETKYKFVYEKNILEGIGKFSGWSLFANLSVALGSQGILMLLNMFFSPAVVAARAISLQVNGLVDQFVRNFRTAANPQIVKRYAAGDFEGHKSLLLQSTKYSFFLLYLIGLPVILSAYPLLHIWLGVVPEYTVIFLQIVIVQSFFSVFDVSLYQALYAKGELKWNALTAPTIGFISFPIVYVCFKNGFSPVALSWVYLCSRIVLGCVQKPILLIKVVGYKWSDFFPMYMTCLKVVVFSLPIPMLYYFNCSNIIGHEFVDFILMSAISVFCVSFTIWFIGIDKALKERILYKIKSRINKI